LTLRNIARSATILVALGFAVGAWVWFPGNSIGGRWTASSPQQSLDIVVTQQPDGSVRVPKALQPYLGGRDVLEAPSNRPALHPKKD